MLGEKESRAPEFSGCSLLIDGCTIFFSHNKLVSIGLPAIKTNSRTARYHLHRLPLRGRRPLPLACLFWDRIHLPAL
jgi:hypothetical protein